MLRVVEPPSPPRLPWPSSFPLLFPARPRRTQRARSARFVCACSADYFLIDDENTNPSSGTFLIECPCIAPPGGIDASYTYASPFVISGTTSDACDDCGRRLSKDRIYEVVTTCAGSYVFSKGYMHTLGISGYLTFSPAPPRFARVTAPRDVPEACRGLSAIPASALAHPSPARPRRFAFRSLTQQRRAAAQPGTRTSTSLLLRAVEILSPSTMTLAACNLQLLRGWRPAPTTSMSKDFPRFQVVRSTCR